MPESQLATIFLEFEDATLASGNRSKGQVVKADLNMRFEYTPDRNALKRKKQQFDLESQSRPSHTNVVASNPQYRDCATSKPADRVGGARIWQTGWRVSNSAKTKPVRYNTIHTRPLQTRRRKGEVSPSQMVGIIPARARLLYMSGIAEMQDFGLE